MRYVSTRGGSPDLGFDAALLAGLAPDGGLYVPAAWPEFSAEWWRELRGLGYAELALRVMTPFVGGAIPEDELAELIVDSYRGFRHPAVAPLSQIGAND